MCEKHYKLIFVMEVDALSRAFNMTITRKKAPFIPSVGDSYLIGNGLEFYVTKRLIPVSMDVITINLRIDSLISDENIAFLEKCGWRKIEEANS